MAQQRLNINTVDRGFWLINEEHVFSDSAYKLFGILLHLFNIYFWPEYIEKTDDYFTGCIHTSRNTLRKARNELVAAGIIECKQGGRGRSCPTRYNFSAHILDVRLTTKADTSINDIKENNIKHYGTDFRKPTSKAEQRRLEVERHQYETARRVLQLDEEFKKRHSNTETPRTCSESNGLPDFGKP